MSIKEKLIIIGAGGHGKVCADIAKLCGYENISFLDDNTEGFFGGYEIIGKVLDYKEYLQDSCFFVAIGNGEIRRKFFEMLENDGAKIVSLIHPFTSIAEDVQIGKGSAVMAGAVINSGTVIGKGSIINTCASVDHDCALDDYVHVAVGAHVCGTVSIGKNVWVGAGSTVINNVSICDDCFIGAGAVVVKDIDVPGKYVGVPAKIIER
ncbi:MAG: acetyltransferase [Oscillospiraceae bacterium]|nr:acetyltransferase [Oscillospiraceae bacterium]